MYVWRDNDEERFHFLCNVFFFLRLLNLTNVYVYESETKLETKHRSIETVLWISCR